MELESFCIQLSQLKLSNAERAISILWFFDRQKPGIALKVSRLTSIIRESGLGNPHSTQLKKSIERTECALNCKSGFKLKPTERKAIKERLKPILAEPQTEVDLERGYLPEAIWKDTRGYIERVAFQVNGCFQCRFYDSASVMVRRLVETLLIECYESKKLESHIKDSDGNYLMLSGIVKDAVDKNRLLLGRETKHVLRELKTMGDRAAHTRRYNAVEADLEKVRSGVRLVVDELIQLAELKR